MDNKIAVIFDMDGVISHTNPYHAVAFRSFFSTRNLSPSDEEFAKHMFGKSNRYIFTHFLKRSIEGEELIALEEEKESLFRKIYEPHVEPIAGLVDFITDLKNHEAKIGVATSAPIANLDLILSKIDIRSNLSSILASENVKNHKPDPEIYIKSAVNLGIATENCVVFEDSFSGVMAAINAGMKVVGVLTSHRQEELPPCNMYVDNYKLLSYQKIVETLFV